MIYIVEDQVIFKKGRATHAGKILEIARGRCKSGGVDRRPVTIETTLKDLAGKEHRGTITVPYCNIVGFQEGARP